MGAPGPRAHPRGVCNGGSPVGLGLNAKLTRRVNTWGALSVSSKGLLPQLVGPESLQDVGVRET